MKAIRRSPLFVHYNLHGGKFDPPLTKVTKDLFGVCREKLNNTLSFGTVSEP